MTVAISIDWDYVTGDCSSEEGHCGFCPNGVKEGGVGIRGEGESTNSWRERLSEVRNLLYPRGIPVYVAECHADIFGVLKSNINGRLDIIDYDSHYDEYDYENRWLCCGNWITYARRLYNLSIISREFDPDFNAQASNSCNVVPDSKREGKVSCRREGCFKQKKVVAKDSAANMVFLCKSSPWTPKNMDKLFYELVKYISKKTGTKPIFIGHKAVEMESEYRNVRKL